MFENTILKTFQKSYEDVLIKEETLRKDIATMIYCFYTNNKSSINHYIKSYMLDSSIHEAKYWDGQQMVAFQSNEPSSQVGMFTPKTVQIMPKIHIDIVNKVLDLSCTIYNSGCDRYLVNEDGTINEDETRKLLDIYNGFFSAKKLKEIYKQGYLFNTVLSQVVFRKDKIDIDILTPNFVSVISEDEDYTQAQAILISKSIDNNDTVVYWSDTEHFYYGVNNKKESFEGNEGMQNPFGELPFAKLSFQQSSDYWGEPQQELIENNIWYDVRESNNMFVEMFQGLGVGVGINLGKQGVVSISPDTIILVDGVMEGSIPPSLEFATTNAPLTELKDNADAFYKKIGNSKGLSGQSVTNEVSEASGISKLIDSQELAIKKDSHKDILKSFESDLFEKIRMVNNYYSEVKISDKVKFRIDFVEDEPPASVNDEIAKLNFKLENNIISIVDVMLRDNQDITDEDARMQLEKNKEINLKYLNPKNEKEIVKANTN